MLATSPWGKRTTDATRVGAQLSDHPQDLTRVMNRLKACIAVGELLVRAPRFMLRAAREWLSKLPQAGVRRRAELLYQQLMDCRPCGERCDPSFWREPEHKAAKLLASDTLHRSGRAARLIALNANPAPVPQQATTLDYSGWALRPTTVRIPLCGVDNCNSPRNLSKLRGLNRNHNHEMKEIFKSAATRASCGRDRSTISTRLAAKGMKRRWRV